MLYVYDHDKLLSVIDTTKYADHENRAEHAIIRKKLNNVHTLEIDIPTNCEASQSITKTSDIVLYDTKGKVHEYHITELLDYHKESVLRTIYCELSVGELIENIITDKVKKPTSKLPADYLAYILAFTRFKVGTIDPKIAHSQWRKDILGMNCLEALMLFVDKYNCEFEVRYETDGKNKITDRFIDIKKQIGKDIGKRFEYTKDINSLKRKDFVDNVKTAIYPRIAKTVTKEDGTTGTEYVDISSVTWSTAAGNPTNKPKGDIILVNPDIDPKYKRVNSKDNSLMERVMYAEWTDQTATDAEDLIRQAWAILRANAVPDLSYEISANDLYVLSNDPDLSHEQVDLGDTALLVDKEFQPELRLSSRIIEMEENLICPVNNLYVFGKARETIATNNQEVQKTIEDRLNELKQQVGGMKIPEYNLPYQNGKGFYSEMKETIQNDFITSSGYVMIEDNDGLWVFDRPNEGNPTKAVIVKGGSLAIAEYDVIKSQWIVGTFIDGTSVNADFINTGHLKGDIIEGHSIKSNHLSVEAVDYIQNGMASNTDLDRAVTEIENAKSNINIINGEISKINKSLEDALSGVLDSGKLEVIKNNLLSLESEYSNMITRVERVYVNQYLPAGTEAKIGLASSRDSYIGAYNEYKNCINTVISDNNVTEDEKADIDRTSKAYNEANTKLIDALEIANDTILTNVYAQARAGLVTQADLEVNNTSVIAKAKQGMVTTNDMTNAIEIATKDLVNAEEVSESIKGAVGGLTTAEQLADGLAKTKIPMFKETLKSVAIEYTSNIKKVDKLLSNSYLRDTAKSNLVAAKGDYVLKYQALEKAVNDMVTSNSVAENLVQAYDSALTGLKDSTAQLTQYMHEASDNINANIQKESKEYADNLKLELDKELVEVGGSVTSLKEEITTSFKDSIISEAEALAIKSNIATLTTEKIDIDKEYAKLSGNGSANSDVLKVLTEKKTGYDTAHNELINAIKTAIADNSITQEERNNVESKFTLYHEALSNYRGAAQDVIDNIATNKANSAVDDLVVGSRNLVLGSSDQWTDLTNFTGGENDGRIRNTKVLTTGLAIGDKLLLAFEYKLTDVTYPQGVTWAQVRWQGYGDVTGWGAGSFLGALIPNMNKFPSNDTGTAYLFMNITADHLKNSYWMTNLRIDHIAGGTISIRSMRAIKSSILVDWTPAPEDTSSAIDKAVENLPTTSDVESAKNNAIIAAKIESIKQTLGTVTNEYNNNKTQADTLYKNTYLSGDAKVNLLEATTDYTNKFNASKVAHDDIVSKQTLSPTQLSAWNKSITDLQVSTKNLAQKMQEASAYINTAVYNASKDYTDKAIPDALTGYAKTSYVDTAKQQAITDAKKGMVSTSELQVNNTEILMATSKMGQTNLLRNSDFRKDLAHWNVTGVDTASGEKVQITSTDVNGMAGEKACMILTPSEAEGTKNIRVQQDVTLVKGISYTLGYWVNTVHGEGDVLICRVSSNGSLLALASKHYTAKNGTQNRDTWTYDSLTITTENTDVDYTYRVMFRMTKKATGVAKMLFVKPMFTTGINAQAWTGHPEEIYVGVVSITEERGIMVEHSDSATYSTLNSDGLKIWEYNSESPVASFGEGNVAYIDTVSTKKLVCNTVMPTVEVYADLHIYFSNTGSGDYSGKDSNNCCAGFTGAMSTLCEHLGVDTTHVRGNMMIKGDGKITIHAVGTSIDEEFHLENMYGTANLTIDFAKSIVQTGSMEFLNIHTPLRIQGNRSGYSANDGCLIKRNGDTCGIYIKHCTKVELGYMRFSNSQKLNSGVEITDGSNVFIDRCDFLGYTQGIYCNKQSKCYIEQCSGTSGSRGCYVNNAEIIYNAYIPAGNSKHDIPNNIWMANCSVRQAGTYPTHSPMYSVQAAPPITSQVITNSFGANAYRSDRSYSISDLYQASWDGSGGYGDYVGKVWFNELRGWLSNASNYSAQIYLQRQSGGHGYSSGARVRIYGSEVGSLNLGEGKWFNVPVSLLTAIKNGSIDHVPLNGTGNDHYIKFEKNAVIRVTATKTV